VATHIDTEPRVVGGRYRLGDVLGRGGMATVYDGVDERLGRPVAVKVLRAELAARPEVRERFDVEARAAALLCHPNVVAVYDSGADGGGPWIVMERLPGETLADRLRAGPLAPAEACRVAADVLAALGAAHAAGVLHRDVKPGNILIAADGRAKVADFGIAKTAEAAFGGDVTITGTLLGTPAYLAPERIDGQPATPQSDLYAVGVVLYEALSGRRPFAGDTPVATAYNVQHAEAPPLTGVDPALAAAVAGAMSRDPALRPASAEAMAASLGVAPETLVLTLSPPADETVVLERSRLVPRAAAPMRVPVRAMVAAATVGLLLFLVVAAIVDRGGAGAPAATTATIASTTTTALTTTTTAAPVAVPERHGRGKKGGDGND
jgi:serine/threonine-protein kinase